MANEIRDVRTLLMCSVNANKVREKTYKECYTSIYAGPDANGCRQFVTYGNFDAISIYKTQGTEGEEWLKSIENDNKEIAKHISRDMCYLPIHLITYQNADVIERFWDDHKTLPVCLTTLLYGVTGGKNDINKYLEELLKTGTSRPDSKLGYIAYQAIDICDAVVIWLTDDIHYALDRAAQFVRGGFARKTYSLVGIDRSKMISDDIGKSKEALGEQIKNPGDKPFSLRIQGSIRDHEEAPKLFFDQLPKKAELRDWVGLNASVVTSCVFGNEDFTIDIQVPGVKGLLELFYNMLENSDVISDACWEIHTEFLQRDSYQNGKKYNGNSKNSILNSFTFYTDKDLFDQHLSKLPWASSYLELLATHVNIESDPILQDTASLFTKVVQIVNEYIKRAYKPGPDEENNKSLFQDVLCQSGTSMMNFIRLWSHLTDRLMQSDDLVFHGIGRDPAIFEALPESILKYYHDYLHRVVKNIIALGDEHGLENGKEQGWTAWGYDFDFLLVPEQDAETRISKLFKTTRLHGALLGDSCNRSDNCKGCAVKQNCMRRRAWPEKQVYIVEFQTGLLYDPPNFLFPVLHECFHIFGDKFRLRERRAELFVDVITLEIQYQLGLDKPWNTQIRNVLQKKLCVSQPCGLSLVRLERRVYDNWRKLFSGNASDSYNKICKQLTDPYYMSGEVYGKWKKMTEEFQTALPPNRWEKMLEKWEYYFHECYADLMSLLWLNLPLDTYLHQADLVWNMRKPFEDDLSNIERVKFIQRISLVLAAFSVTDRKSVV